MEDYPYLWIGEQASGVVSRYCKDGFRLNNDAPEVGDFVFRNWDDRSTAYKVTYSDRKTGRIRVSETDFELMYNEVLREHRKKHGRDGPDPADSRISLVKRVENEK